MEKKSPALEGATGHDEIPDLAASNRELVLILVLQPLLSKPFQDATTDKNRNGQRWTRQGERLICN